MRTWLKPLGDCALNSLAIFLRQIFSPTLLPAMKHTSACALLAALLASSACARPTVDETYPYNGPAIPVGDWVDPTPNGNGKGFPRLVEAPAVKPASANPTNNINVISLSYLPRGIHIHYQTPFGLGVAPSVHWGRDPKKLHWTAHGFSHTYVGAIFFSSPFERGFSLLADLESFTSSYDRTPSCAEVGAVTQCSQFFHEVQLDHLEFDTTYYYQIPAANGTTASEVLSFKTGRRAGDEREFTVAVLNDMGYTNAQGTYKQLTKAVEDGAAFAWHGGDISYADDWYSGILPCASDWPVCYNGTSTHLPGGGPIPPEYDMPLPAGEIPNQGTPYGGDMSALYESNWDLWQQWITKITTKVPYMVLPGNHEAACAEFDGPGNILTAYLNEDKSNSTAPKANLTYYSCPPSQRNFTAFQHRFRMPGSETGGVSNFWYSFDYGMAHFVSIDSETDYAYSPEWPFARDIKGDETTPTPDQTYSTDSGPFGAVDGSYNDTKAYAQYKWLKEDLASVDRKKTPWVIVMGHRPMYSSGVSGYEKNLRNAFEDLMLEHGVDAYLSGHIHWYERLWPLGVNATIDKSAIIDNHTYRTNPGTSMTHIVNGMAGNLESHSELRKGESILNITVLLDTVHYGFSKMTFVNSTALKWEFVRGEDGSQGDYLWLVKPDNGSGKGEHDGHGEHGKGGCGN